MDLDKATELAMQTNYAHDAVEPEGNEINQADAGAFFLEGYLYGKAELTAEVKRLEKVQQDQADEWSREYARAEKAEAERDEAEKNSEELADKFFKVVEENQRLMNKIQEILSVTKEDIPADEALVDIQYIIEGSE